MTQPNSIFSHADVPVDPEYLRRVAADHAGASMELVFVDGVSERGYDPETLKALREAALGSAGAPMPDFTFPDVHEPVPAPKHKVKHVKFSHAKKHEPVQIVPVELDQTVVFNDGGAVSHVD